MNNAGLLASTFAAAALCGCVDQPNEASNAGISFEEYKATATREPVTGAYVVDWDVVLHGDEALYDYWQQFQQGGLTIYVVGGLDIKWSDAQKRNLTYCIGNGFGANKQLVIDAMKAATVDGWEKLGNVKFSYDTTQDATCTAANNNVLFDVNPAPQGAPYLARAFFPNSPRNERNVLIESASFNPNQTGGISLANITIHELGHVLGFRHEHIRRPNQVQNCIEDAANNLQYRGITAYDQISTMHYPQCGSPGNTLALSALDRDGIRLVYGPVNAAPMASLTSPVNGAIVPRSFRVVSSVLDDDLARVELHIDGALAQTKTQGPFEFDVADLTVGQHTLELRGIDGANQTAITTVTVTVQSGSGGGNGGGGGNDGGDGDGDGGGTDVVGGCSTGGGAGLLLGLGLLGLVRRRRR